MVMKSLEIHTHEYLMWRTGRQVQRRLHVPAFAMQLSLLALLLKTPFLDYTFLYLLIESTYALNHCDRELCTNLIKSSCNCTTARNTFISDLGEVLGSSPD